MLETGQGHGIKKGAALNYPTAPELPLYPNTYTIQHKRRDIEADLNRLNVYTNWYHSSFKYLVYYISLY